MKPLSDKSLQRLYKKLNLLDKDVELIHKYFLCFSNLYGIIEIPEAYKIYKKYEDEYISYDQFIQLSKIIQREKQPYLIVDINEIYSDEEKGSLDFIVNKKLVGYGPGKFFWLYHLEENSFNKPYYIPDKKELFMHEEDQFYKTVYGLNMKSFVENLVSDGMIRHGVRKDKIVDINGNYVENKKLKDIIFFTSFEKYEIEHSRNEIAKKRFIDEYSVPCSEKVLNRIDRELRVGRIDNDAFSKDLEYLIGYIEKDFGAVLDVDSLEEFVQLYMQLNNNSNLWLNKGYSPTELSKETKFEGTPIIEIGPNMERLLKEEGTYEKMMEFLQNEGMTASYSDENIKISDLVNAMQDNNEEISIYYSKQHNRLVFFDSYLDDMDDLDYDDLISIPDRYDINEYKMMQDYIELIEDETIRNALYISIRGKGAFSRFKDMLYNYDLLKEWYEYKNIRYENIAISWCIKNNINFKE